MMKQVTLEIDEATFDSAETKARQAGTSLTELVLGFLKQFSGSGISAFEQLEAQEEALRRRLCDRGADFSGADRLSRDELHERHATR